MVQPLALSNLCTQQTIKLCPKLFSPLCQLNDSALEQRLHPPHEQAFITEKEEDFQQKNPFT